MNFNIEQFLDMSNDEILKKNGRKKFDIVLMNPPYDGSLHLRFLEKCIKIGENIISIQPSDPFVKINIKSKLADKLKSFIDDIEIFKAKDIEKMFNIWSSSDLGIIVAKQKGAKGYIAENSNFKDIINKIRKQKSIRSSINYHPKKNEEMDNKFVFLQGDYGYAKSWHYTLEQIIKGHPGAGIKFNTVEEANNFKDALLNCWPYKFMYYIDDNAAVIAHLPFMGDYTKQWTDKRFYKYFDIDENKQKEIEEYIKTRE